MEWHTVSKLSPHMDETAEGYLICRDVPIARTGTQIYWEGEVPPLQGDAGGRVHVERPEDEVFADESVRSFIGKPVVDDHPAEGVGPDNWSDLSIGYVSNPRRGEAPNNDLLLADLIFTTRRGIDAVRKRGKRAISVGYNAAYDQTAPGLGIQKNIFCNHVALVDEGRCGRRCTILDGAPVYDYEGAIAAFADAGEFVESEHPRDDDGKFSETAGGGAAVQVASMKKVGGQLGSNPGGRYEDSTGAQFYVKQSKSESHAKNEILASRLYSAAGSPVLHVHPADLGGGKLGTATRWKGVTPIDRKKPDDRRAAQQHFATHAWLSNWDAVGLEYDNQGRIGGEMHTLDVGGSLLYRAQGGPKGEAFGNKVGEWDTLRHPSNHQAHTVFGEMTPEQLQGSASRVAKVSDATIRKLVDEHGPGTAEQKAALAEKLIARKQDIIGRAGVAAPSQGGPPESPASKPGQPATPPTAPTGAAAWKAALPQPPSYVKAFAGKIQAAVTAHAGEPHELVPTIKQIAASGAHNPNNTSYANKVLKHLAAASTHDAEWFADVDYPADEDIDYRDAWVESEHPRGQPGNAGQFATSAGGGTSISSGLESGGFSTGGHHGWKTSLPEPPTYVKSFGEKIKAAVASHLGEPHELVPKIKEIASGAAHNPNNISYANKVLKHLAAASFMHPGAVGSLSAKKPAKASPVAPTPTPAPAPATAPASGGSEELAALPQPTNPDNGYQKNMLKVASGNAPPLEKAQALSSYINSLKGNISGATEAYGNSLVAALGAQHGTGTSAKPVKVDGPIPHPQSKPQQNIYKLATDPATTPAEKIAAIKANETVQNFPEGFTAKFANEWTSKIAEAYGIPQETPADPTKPTPAPKPAPKPPKPAANAPRPNVHGVAAQTPSNIVTAKPTARTQHAIKTENNAKQPNGTDTAMASQVAPSVDHSFWTTVPQTTKEAIGYYGGSGYTPMNKALRGEAGIDPHWQKKIDAIDEQFFREEAVAKEDVIVRRGEDTPDELIAAWREQLAKGPPPCLYPRSGYTSASMANTPAFGHKSVWFHFVVPKGKPLLGIAGTVGHGENEVLLHHGQQTEIYEIYDAGGKTHVKAILR
jgi:hypothetical protein